MPSLLVGRSIHDGQRDLLVEAWADVGEEAEPGACRGRPARVFAIDRRQDAFDTLPVFGEEAGEFKNLYLDTDLGHLDCLSEIQGLGGYEQVKRASVSIEVEGRRFRVLSIDALITAKEALNRPRDREAVRQLKALPQLRGENPSNG